MTTNHTTDRRRTSDRGTRELSRAQFLRLSGLAAGAVVGTGTLTGCSGFVGGGGGGDEKKLTAFFTTEQRAGLGSLTKQFEKETGLAVDGSYQGTDALNKQLRTQLSSGTAPDMFRVAPGSGAPTATRLIAKDDYIVDLSNESWADAVPTSLDPLAKLDGKLYAFPNQITTIATFYNKKVWSDLGLPIPKTWSELLDVCKELKKAGKTPIALGLAEPTIVQLWLYALVASLVFSKDPDFNKKMLDGDATFAGSGYHEAFEKFVSLTKMGYTTPKPLGNPPDHAYRALGTGKAGMMTMVAATLPNVVNYAPGGADDLGVFPTPATESSEDIWVGASPNLMAINAKTERIEEVKKFFDFLAQPENVTTYAKNVLSLPGLTVKGARGHPLLEPLLPYLQQGKTTPFMNQVWPNPDVQQTLFTVGQQVFSDEISIDGALKKMDQAYRKGSG